jgi:hypothetical protein
MDFFRMVETKISLKEKTLFLGIGGGFDIYGAIPLFEKGVLANVNLSEKTFGKASGDTPEGLLNEWMGNKFPFYTLPRCGVRAMASYLKEIVKENGIEEILCIDGGVDSLMRGDEENPGTLLEDTVTMIAVNELSLPATLACIGFGTETEESVCHYHVLENMAYFTKIGAFLGSFSLVKNERYKEACEYGWKNSRKSHIHTKILSAMAGEFDYLNLYSGVEANVANDSKKCYINPLMNIMWFFDLKKIVGNNLLTNYLKNTNTMTDVMIVFRQLLANNLVKRKSKPIPL